MKEICDSILLFTSFLGIYEIIRILWEYIEIKETGSSIITHTDTTIAVVLSLAVLLLLFIGSTMKN